MRIALAMLPARAQPWKEPLLSQRAQEPRHAPLEQLEPA
jgi:hypothetical protein